MCFIYIQLDIHNFMLLYLHLNESKYWQGKEIIEHFIEELRKEGVTFVPRWEEPSPKALPEACIVKESKKCESDESSSDDSERRDRTSSTQSGASRELKLGASATNLPNIEKVNLNEGRENLFLVIEIIGYSVCAKKR